MVVPPAIVWLYGRDVRPLLRARGLHADSSNAELIGDDLVVGATRVWPLTLTRPRVGRVYAVSATRRQTFLYDTVVEWRDGLPTEPGEIRVKVHEVTGERSICSITDAPTDQLVCEDWPVAMLAGDHATFLVGLFPDSDTLWIWNCWPHERLPLRYVRQRPRTLAATTKALVDLFVIDESRWQLAVECDFCEGNQLVTCPKCNGGGSFPCPPCRAEGRFDCQRCKTSGTIPCFKCRSAGSWTCPRCNGSGRHPQGQCHLCVGKGRLPCKPCGGNGQLTCRDCAGSGRRQCIPCGATGQRNCLRCAASGQIDCPGCGGRGARIPRWRRHSASLQLRQFVPHTPPRTARQAATIMLPLAAAWLDDREEDRDVPFPRGGAVWLESLRQTGATDKLRGDTCLRAVADHQQRLRGFETIFDHILSVRDERATGPVRFRRSPKAIRVSHDEVVFRLELERNRHFELTTGELPFPPKSQLVFSHSPKPSDAGGVRLRWQVSAKAETASPPSARLQSGGSSGTRAFVDVAFPRGIDEASIPTEGFFSADRPYPAERIMQAEVRRWTRADNRLNPVLNAVVNPSPTKPRAPAIRPRNPGIAKFRGQLAAVELGLAETPLVLIKGPPGTGKTTVIVELILQAAARGERVLVTSQTHQAVRNVLERLDRLGEVRIFRYGRDEKLSPLERKYARGGAAAADGRSTLIRARKRADAARRAYEQEAVDVIAYEAAVVAIEQLAGLAAERDNALAASEAQEQADREQAVACRERSDAQASAAAQATCDQIDRENALIESESQSAAAGLALLDARREILGGPPFGESPPVPLDFEAPLRLRRQRLRACLVAVRQHEHRLTAANRDHAALTAVLDTANQARQTQLAEAKSTLDKALAAADATLARAENEAANVRQQELDSAAADRKTAQAAAEKRLGTELARAERARNQLSLRELRTDRRMQTLDSQLDRFASGVRKLAGRNPRKTAPRQGILTRFFKHSSVEVLEGEWAHAAEARAALQTECVALAQARLEATAGAEKLRRQLEQAVAEIDAEYDQRNQSRTAAWERTLAAARTRHATETTRGHEAFQASKAVAERAYSEAVGDRPGQASRTATLRQLEAAQLHWWVAWRDALGQADGIEGSLETSVQHQLSGRELDSQDDDCSPTEASARLAELDQGTRILRGILITAEARLETNSERRRRATAECASQKARAAETLNARLAAIPTERARRDDSIHRRVALDRSRCLKQIGTAVGIARARGVNAAADDGPEAWQERIADREAVVGPLRETMEFTHRWVAELTKSVGVVEQLHWRHIDVFLATCVGVATWRRFNETGPDAVDLVIVDEAAHATLPEVLAPLRFGRRAILIGDEMQLPPINDVDTHSVQPKNDWLPADRLDDVPKSAAVAMSDNWMERSLFEWVFLRRRAVPRVMLDRQFRMHPDIGDFISSVFYAGKLRNGVDAADRHLSFGDFQAAVSVVSTSQYRERHERREQGGAGASYSNPAEAEIVLRILGQAVVGLTEAASFGVITPYAAQKRLLQHRIATDLPDRAHVRLDPDEDVGSVDSYQGSERDCIIVSMVRSPRSCPHCRGTGLQRGRRCRTCRGRGVAGAGLSFARDLRRLNVAFSRARCMLIVIGDFDRLCDTSVRGGEDGGKVLQQFSEHVLNRRGVVQHVWEADGHAG